MDSAFIFGRDESLEQVAVDEMDFEFDFEMCHGTYVPSYWHR